MFWLSPSPASLNVADSTPASEMAEVADTKCGWTGTIRSSRVSSDGRNEAGRLWAAPRARNQESNMGEPPSEGWPAVEVEGPSPGGAQTGPAGMLGRARQPRNGLVLAIR